VGALLLKHVALPAVAPVSLLGLYFTPVQVFGCVNRGLMALGIAAIAAGAAVATTVVAHRARRRNDPRYQFWILSSLVLTVSLALLIGLA
jgi:hypothetical protein